MSTTGGSNGLEEVDADAHDLGSVDLSTTAGSNGLEEVDADGLDLGSVDLSTTRTRLSLPGKGYPVHRDQQAHQLAQGPRLTALHGREPAGSLSFESSGSVTLDGNTIAYDLAMGSTGVRYRPT